MFADANAQTVVVSAIDEISTANPKQNVSVRLLEPLMISNEQILNSDVILTGDVTNVKNARRLKRDAKFVYEVKEYQTDDDTHQKLYIKAKYTSKIDKKELAKKAALGVGVHFVKGISPGIALIEGAIKNESGNRVKSSIYSMYKSSPLSYIEKGNELEIPGGQYFYLKFPDVKTDNKKTCNNKK
jgi:hypothetical protein